MELFLMASQDHHAVLEANHFLLIWHTFSNIICGIAFFGVAYCFNALMRIIKLSLLLSANPDIQNIWNVVGQYRYVYNLLSLVFLFCGSGHFIDAILPFFPHLALMEFIHGITAVLGSFLIFSLWNEFYGFKN